jgi:hypothetical protein
MKETGIIVNLKGDVAVVKVKREAASDCCHLDATKDAFLEAYNNCNAALYDTVLVESDEDTAKRLGYARFGIYIAGFFAGLVLGAWGAELSGFAHLRTPLGLATGAGAALLSHLLYTRILAPRFGISVPVVREIVYDI